MRFTHCYRGVTSRMKLERQSLTRRPGPWNTVPTPCHLFLKGLALIPGSPASSYQFGASPEENLLPIEENERGLTFIKCLFCTEHLRGTFQIFIHVFLKMPVWENHYHYFVEKDTEAQRHKVNSERFTLLVVKARGPGFEPALPDSRSLFSLDQTPAWI